MVNSVRQMAEKPTKTRKRSVSSEASEVEAVIPPKRATKRQKHSPKASEAKAYGRKLGWRATGDMAIHRTFDSDVERTGKQNKWRAKKKKVKTAFVKTIVKNSFAKETGKGWKGKRYKVRDIIMEKKVMLQPLILPDKAHIS